MQVNLRCPEESPETQEPVLKPASGKPPGRASKVIDWLSKWLDRRDEGAFVGDNAVDQQAEAEGRSLMFNCIEPTNRNSSR